MNSNSEAAVSLFVLQVSLFVASGERSCKTGSGFIFSCPSAQVVSRDAPAFQSCPVSPERPSPSSQRIHHLPFPGVTEILRAGDPNLPGSGGAVRLRGSGGSPKAPLLQSGWSSERWELLRRAGFSGTAACGPDRGLWTGHALRDPLALMERCVIPASPLCPGLRRGSSRSGRWWRARGSALLAGLCCVYLLVSVLQVSPSPAGGDPGVRASAPLRPPAAHDPNLLGPPEPSRSNVVYITLRSRRHRPAVIRATVKPKQRRKRARSPGARGAGRPPERGDSSTDPWAQVVRQGLALYRAGPLDQPAAGGSSIRVYSLDPPWLSPGDLAHMRQLAGSGVRALERAHPEGSPAVLLFRGGAEGPAGVVGSPVDMSEVFGFHLDRVLGLNRSLPAVSRRFWALDNQLCPVTLWDPSISPVSGQLTWSSYQTSLTHRCWQRGAPRPEWGCTSIHHHEWSKVALFDFLLQIHQRLDRSCCGFRPLPEDSCVVLGYHGDCGDGHSVELSNIVHRKHDPHHLVFINNKGFFDRDEGNLNFRLLEGIKELPGEAVGVLRSRRLREKLLQSLFLDQLYWDSQGGRPGIEKLIDVIERRARVLLRYINAHGISVTPMNT